jgi:biotin carboxyl carrier protein
MEYTLAGAYDSNIALLLTVGDSRESAYERMAEVLRASRLRGKDLATNLAFHYGLVHWFLGRTVNARPTTQFIVPYLTAVGELAQEAGRVDVDVAWQQLCAARVKEAAAGQDAVRKVLAAKESLLLRPIKQLMASPHLLSGWLSLNQDAFRFEDGHFSWAENPIEVLADTYHFLRLDWNDALPAANMIWDHDHAILSDAEDFYSELSRRFETDDWAAISDLLSGAAPDATQVSEWKAIQAAHRGYQAGAEILELLPAMAQFTGFYDLDISPDLTIDLPERLLDEDHQKAMAKALAPPPVAKSDEIVAASGGMFYGREAPEAPLYVAAGQHFNAGEPLYIVEVMKMFNKVLAPFSGTVDEVLVEGDGVIISKGQTLFKVTPDEKVEVLSDGELAALRREHTTELAKLFI